MRLNKDALFVLEKKSYNVKVVWHLQEAKVTLFLEGLKRTSKTHKIKFDLHAFWKNKQQFSVN